MRTFCLLLLFAVATFAQTAKVSHVSDGDSFILASGERVRMIGINAPELKDPFGQQAKEHLAGLIGGKTVMLERDQRDQGRDQYDRLLRFVSVDGRDINRQMITDGYAYAFLRYPFAEEKRVAYREEESAAKRSKLGIWAAVPTGDAPPVAIDPPAQNSNFPPATKWIMFAVIVGVVVFGIRFAMRR